MNNNFEADVLNGLLAPVKHLPSKYFYDAKGDEIFQRIMATPEYYPTKCEQWILKNLSEDIIKYIQKKNKRFDVVELGAGDATKTIHFLNAATKTMPSFRYLPIDISKNITDMLLCKFKDETRWKTVGINAEYLNGIDAANGISHERKLFMLLGCNIGNMEMGEAIQFLTEINQRMKKGDNLLIGFDLNGEGKDILRAYNDSQGNTRDFNLNLLSRINRELLGTFNTDDFIHTPTFCNKSGECRSYLTSNVKHTVFVAGHQISFEQGEKIYMELSKKYTIEEISMMAEKSGFTMDRNFMCNKGWFTDSLWTKK